MFALVHYIASWLWPQVEVSPYSTEPAVLIDSLWLIFQPT